MKICGIICEYNPFHNGHKWQIDYLKQKLGFDYVAVCLSGNFSQRATPSIVDKFSKLNLIENVDLICQIPTAYSINNGEVFATAGIKLLNGLGINYVCFGVETLNENLFFELAENMLNETSLYKQNLKEELKKGLSFKTANLNSIKKSFSNGEEFAQLISQPNNILALEYIKAIKKYKYNITPILIKRESNFSQTDCQNNIVSASQIRKFLENNQDISNFVPKLSGENLIKNFNKNYKINFEKLVFDMMLNFDIEKLKKTYLVSEGIENRIIESILTSKNYNELISTLVTKRYDLNKINRILLNYILGIDKEIISRLYCEEFEYIKILMANKDILKNLCPKAKLILRKNDVTPKIENDKLQQIENKCNLLANNIFDKNISFYDIFIKAKIQ